MIDVATCGEMDDFYRRIQSPESLPKPHLTFIDGRIPRFSRRPNKLSTSLIAATRILPILPRRIGFPASLPLIPDCWHSQLRAYSGLFSGLFRPPFCCVGWIPSVAEHPRGRLHEESHSLSLHEIRWIEQEGVHLILRVFHPTTRN